MDYIGSKKTLVPWINSTINDIVGADLTDKIFCDIFAGTNVVGSSIKKRVKKVISNDLESYSFVLGKNYIGNHLEIKDKSKYIEELNNLDPIYTGFIYQNYCLGSDSGRQYFTDANGQKIDAIRKKINQWYATETISDNLYYFLLASLIESADKVANTVSVYGAFLKHLKKRANKEFVLKEAKFVLNSNNHEVYQENANDLIKKITGNILYLDPPYNRRQYGANYHLLNTIAEYNDFKPIGKTGLREYTPSDYCKKTKAADTLEDLVQNANFEYIFLSYNNEGIINNNEIKSIMKKYGTYHLKSKNYQRFNTIKGRNSQVKEHIHILKKTKMKHLLKVS